MLDSNPGTSFSSPPVLLLCLAYKNHAEVSDFLHRTLENASSCHLRIVVTDNTPGRILKSTSWLKGNGLLALRKGRLIVTAGGINHGYFGGFRIGLEASREAWGTPAAWTILSNTDLTIRSTSWMRTLYDQSIDRTAIIAPKIISGLSGKNQNPIYLSRPSARKLFFLSRVFSYSWSTALYRSAALVKAILTSHWRIQREPADGTEIYGAHGSFICVPEIYFQRGGQFSCESFLYLEEIFLAEEAANLGIKIRYTDRIVVHHDEHASTSFIPPPHIRKHLASAHRMAARMLSE